MLLVGKTLKRFNEEEVEPANHFEALSYPPHMAACIRSGFVLTPENNTPGKASYSGIFDSKVKGLC